MKRKEPLKVPRASLAVTLLSDPELIELLQSPEGRDAALLFVCLILAAKEQNNAGRFDQAPAVIAMLVRWPFPEFKSALDFLLQMHGRWVVAEQGSIVLRGFTKWNAGWGGAREGAGRPANAESKTNSRRIQEKPTPSLPASVSVVPSELPPPNPPSADATELAEFLRDRCGRGVGVGDLQRLISRFGLERVIGECDARAQAGDAAFANVARPAAVLEAAIGAGENPRPVGVFAKWRRASSARTQRYETPAEEVRRLERELREEAAREGAA